MDFNHTAWATGHSTRTDFSLPAAFSKVTILSVQVYGKAFNIRIPARVKHNLVNTGSDTLRTLVSFSSGDRKTVFLQEHPAK